MVAHGGASSLRGKRVLVGSRHYVETDEHVDLSPLAKVIERQTALGRSLLYLAEDGKIAGLLAIEDPMRPEAAEVVAGLRQQGISRILKVPEGMTLHTVTAFGYPAHACHIVPPCPDGSLKYYMDEQEDFYVPKREEDEFIFAEEYGAHR